MDVRNISKKKIIRYMRENGIEKLAVGEYLFTVTPNKVEVVQCTESLKILNFNVRSRGEKFTHIELGDHGNELFG